VQLGSRNQSIFILFAVRSFRQMGRMHSKGKGVSKSAKPYKRSPPSWLKSTKEEVVDHICKLAKKGLRPSQIGVMLRDAHGIAQVGTWDGCSKMGKARMWQRRRRAVLFGGKFR
jgi:hypothetical protein